MPLATSVQFVAAGQGDARYELAGARIFDNVALILKDARPVQSLMSVGDRPLLAAQLGRETRTGAVRYALIGRPECLRVGGITSFPPVVRWAREHGTDVSRAAGQPTAGSSTAGPRDHANDSGT